MTKNDYIEKTIYPHCCGSSGWAL